MKNWDYSANAIYFLTFNTHQHNCIFGEIENEKMILNDNGKIVENEKLNSIKIRENWLFHNWIVMPNHVPILIEIKKPEILKYNFSETRILTPETDIEYENLFIKKLDNSFVEMHGSASNNISATNNDQENKKTLSRKPKSISSFLGILKSRVTKLINDIMNTKDFDVWQSNFHDHIVRDFQEYKKIYYYIENNPKKWDSDKFNPLNEN